MKHKLHLHLFDDGAEIGGTSEGGLDAGTQVVYGKEETSNDNNDIASHGSDGQDGVETSAEAPNLAEEFDSLIADKYKDVFGAKVKEIDRKSVV